MRDDEELPPEEIRLKVNELSDADAQAYFSKLPLKTQERYNVYWMQRTREIIEAMATLEEDRRD